MPLVLIIAFTLATAIALFVGIGLDRYEKADTNKGSCLGLGVGALVWALVGFASFLLSIFPVMLLDTVTENYHDGYSQERQSGYSGTMRSFKLEKIKTNDSSGEQVKVRFNLDSSGGSELSVYSGLSSDYGVNSRVTKEISCEMIKPGQLPRVEVYNEIKHRVNDSILSSLTDLTPSETVKQIYVFYSPDCNSWSYWENKQQV